MRGDETKRMKWCISQPKDDSWSRPGCVLDRVCLALEPSWMPPGAILVKKTGKNRPIPRDLKREEKKSAQIAAICTNWPSPPARHPEGQGDGFGPAAPSPTRKR